MKRPGRSTEGVLFDGDGRLPVKERAKLDAEDVHEDVVTELRGGPWRRSAQMRVVLAKMRRCDRGQRKDTDEDDMVGREGVEVGPRLARSGEDVEGPNVP
jgi:hypothetical protein